MMKPSFKDLSMHAMYGEIRCSIIAEGASWAPDVANDMVNRMHELWFNTLHELNQFGMLGVEQEEDDEDEFGPTPDKELFEPKVVRLSEEDLDG